MSLPYSVVPRGKVELSSGEVVKIRGLSRAEALLARERYREGGVEAMERYTISRALDVDDLEAVESWYSTAANGDVDRLSAAVARLSGLDVDEGKADAENSLGDADQLDYVVAETLKMTLGEVRALPSAELEEWRDWLIYKAWENQPMANRAGG